MKKLIRALPLLLLCACLTAPALADVIWEPMDDFYFEHYDECVRADEEFTPAADTVLYDSPVKAAVSGALPAGQTVGIPLTWTDPRGHVWGYVELWREGQTVRGWLDLTSPGARPAAVPQSPVVLAAAGVMAAAVVAILLVPGKRRK